MERLKQSSIAGPSKFKRLMDWMMVFVTGFFLILYTLALLGRLGSLSDVSPISRLEPIIFLLLGYYFGRRPAEGNEQTLKSEIERQTRRADAAQQAKEGALQIREALDEKIRNALAVLMEYEETIPQVGGANAVSKDYAPVMAAIHILRS